MEHDNVPNLPTGDEDITNFCNRWATRLALMTKGDDDATRVPSRRAGAKTILDGLKPSTKITSELLSGKEGNTDAKVSHRRAHQMGKKLLAETLVTHRNTACFVQPSGAGSPWRPGQCCAGRNTTCFVQPGGAGPRDFEPSGSY